MHLHIACLLIHKKAIDLSVAMSLLLYMCLSFMWAPGWRSDWLWFRIAGTGRQPFYKHLSNPPPSNELLLVGLAARRPNAKRRGSQEAAILSNRKRYSKAEAAALSNQKELQEAKDWRRTEEAVILNNRNQFYINQSSPNNSVRENSLFGAGVGVGSCHSMARTDRLNARVPRSPTE